MSDTHADTQAILTVVSVYATMAFVFSIAACTASFWFHYMAMINAPPKDKKTTSMCMTKREKKHYRLSVDFGTRQFITADMAAFSITGMIVYDADYEIHDASFLLHLLRTFGQQWAIKQQSATVLDKTTELCEHLHSIVNAYLRNHDHPYVISEILLMPSISIATDLVVKMQSKIVVDKNKESAADKEAKPTAEKVGEYLSMINDRVKDKCSREDVMGKVRFSSREETTKKEVDASVKEDSVGEVHPVTLNLAPVYDVIHKNEL